MQTQINELQAQFEELRIKNIALQTQMQENEQAGQLTCFEVLYFHSY